MILLQIVDSLSQTHTSNNQFWSTVLQIIIGALLSTFFSIIFIIWMEQVRQPRLTITISQPTDLNFGNSSTPAQQLRSLRLLVRNERLPRWLSWWLTRLPAQNCYGIISFFDLNGQNLFGRTMPMRWIRSPEPIALIGHIGNQTITIHDPLRVNPQLFWDIFPGSEELVDIVTRFDNDMECYGWCHENYFSTPPWRAPQWQMQAGIYLVKVEIFTSGPTISGTYRILNDSSVQEFRLGPLIESDPIV